MLTLIYVYVIAVLNRYLIKITGIHTFVFPIDVCYKEAASWLKTETTTMYNQIIKYISLPLISNINIITENSVFLATLSRFLIMDFYVGKCQVLKSKLHKMYLFNMLRQISLLYHSFNEHGIKI